MNYVKIVEWLRKNGSDLKDNWKVVAGVLACVLAAQSVTGLTLTVRSATPGEQPGIIIILPDDTAPLVVGAANDPHQAGEWIIVTRIAIKAAIAILERRAPKTPSEWDDRLLAVLRLIQSDRAAFEAAENAIHSHAVEKIESADKLR
jgi:hypothetical protein